jgi:hypothetical protein
MSFTLVKDRFCSLPLHLLPIPAKTRNRIFAFDNKLIRVLSNTAFQKISVLAFLPPPNEVTKNKSNCGI